MTMRKFHLYFLPFLMVAVLHAEEKVPATVGSALGVPMAEPAGQITSRRSEIENLWNSGKKSQAQKMLEKWRKDEKSSPWSWVVEAKMYFDEKHYKKCLSRGQAALEKSPGCGEAYYWRGRAYEAMDKLLEAANEYRAALMAADSHAEAQNAHDRVLNLLDPARLSAGPSQPVPDN